MRQLLELFRGYDPSLHLTREAAMEEIRRDDACQNLLDQLQSLPAMLCNQFLDLLAWNAAWKVMLLDFDALKCRCADGEHPKGLNIPHQMFCDPDMRDQPRDWPQSWSHHSAGR